MICNRQIYIFFSSQKPPNNTRPQKKKGESERKNEAPSRLWRHGSFTPFDPSSTHTHALARTNNMHTNARIHASLQSHKCILCLTFTHRKQESLWGRCVISMSLSLVVKTAKHRMSSLHAAVLPPSEQRNHSRTQMMGPQSAERPPGLERESYVQMLVF